MLSDIYLFWLISKVKYLYFGMTIAFYCIAIILAFKMALVVKSVSCETPILLCIYTHQFLYCIYYTIKEIQVVESDWNDIIYYFLNEIVEVYTGQKIVVDILILCFLIICDDKEECYFFPDFFSWSILNWKNITCNEYWNLCRLNNAVKIR